MTADQLVRCVLERAIADGLVLPNTDRFVNPDPQQRTYEEIQSLAQMVVHRQKGRYVHVDLSKGNICYE